MLSPFSLSRKAQMSSSNTVKLSSPQIQNVTYIANSLVITTGEDSSPPATITAPDTPGGDWTITLNADRSGSTQVADSFNGQVGGSSHEYAPNGGGTGHSPEQLNFYFGVTITFQTGAGSVPVNVFLAQGHFSSTNNWWIGANAVVNTGTPTLVAIQNNQIAQIFNMGGGTSNFTFTAVS